MRWTADTWRRHCWLECHMEQNWSATWSRTVEDVAFLCARSQAPQHNPGVCSMRAVLYNVSCMCPLQRAPSERPTNKHLIGCPCLSVSCQPPQRSGSARPKPSCLPTFQAPRPRSNHPASSLRVPPSPAAAKSAETALFYLSLQRAAPAD